MLTGIKGNMGALLYYVVAMIYIMAIVGHTMVNKLQQHIVI